MNPKQLLPFLIIAIILGAMVILPGNPVKAALISGVIEGDNILFQRDTDSELSIQDEIQNLQLSDSTEILFDIIIGDYQDDSFNILIEGKEKGINLLEIAHYIPEDPTYFIYTTLMFALKIQCPAGATIIQFIQILHSGSTIFIKTFDQENTEDFTNEKEDFIKRSDSEGNIITEFFDWIKDQIDKIIDKRFGSFFTSWLVALPSKSITF